MNFTRCTAGAYHGVQSTLGGLYGGSSSPQPLLFLARAMLQSLVRGRVAACVSLDSTIEVDTQSGWSVGTHWDAHKHTQHHLLTIQNIILHPFFAGARAYSQKPHPNIPTFLAPAPAPERITWDARSNKHFSATLRRTRAIRGALQRQSARSRRLAQILLS